MRIELHSGRTIYLKKFYQWEAGGMLEGYPNEYINNRSIEEAKRIAGEMHPNLYFFAPKETPIPNVKLPSFMGRAVEIPGIACAAYFRSSAIQKGDDAPLYESYCSMAWFQEEYGLPIEEEILDKIKSLDWDGVAKEYEI